MGEPNDDEAAVDYGLDSRLTPYPASGLGTRNPAHGRRPWKEAGRSHAALADRILARHRQTAGLRRVLAPPAEVSQLRRRAHACSEVARLVDRLTPAGWVIWHDRQPAGTTNTIDHVLIGPAGLVLVATVTHAGTRRGQLAAETVEAIDDQRTLLGWLAGQPLADLIGEHVPREWPLPVTQLFVAVNGPVQTLPGFPTVIAGRRLPGWLRAQPGVYDRLHVTDLAMMLTTAFPLAPLEA